MKWGQAQLVILNLVQHPFVIWAQVNVLLSATIAIGPACVADVYVN